MKHRDSYSARALLKRPSVVVKMADLKGMALSNHSEEGGGGLRRNPPSLMVKLKPCWVVGVVELLCVRYSKGSGCDRRRTRLAKNSEVKSVSQLLRPSGRPLLKNKETLSKCSKWQILEGGWVGDEEGEMKYSFSPFKNSSMKLR